MDVSYQFKLGMIFLSFFDTLAHHYITCSSWKENKYWNLLHKLQNKGLSFHLTCSRLLTIRSVNVFIAVLACYQPTTKVAVFSNKNRLTYSTHTTLLVVFVERASLVKANLFNEHHSVEFDRVSI